MLPYIIIFILVYIISVMAEKFKNDNTKLKILLIIIFFILTLFSGFRSETVGTDILVYIKPVVMYAYDMEILIETSNLEILFILLACFNDLFNGNIVTFLILIQALINFFIIITCYYNKEKLSINNFIFVYMIMFYGITFNLMRQSIAISLVVFSYRFIKEGDWIKYIISMIIATQFHITAVAGFLVWIIYNISDQKIGCFIKYILLIATIIAIFCIGDIIIIAVNLGVLPVKFLAYTTKFLNSEIDIQITAEILKIILFIICYYICSSDKNNDIKHTSTMKFLLIFDLLLFQLGAKIDYAERISYYFSMLVYLMVIPRGKMLTNKKCIYDISIFIILLIYWYITFVHLGVSSIIPYKSDILQI